MKYLPNISIKKCEAINERIKDELMEVEELFIGTELEWEDKKDMLENSASCFFAYDNGRIIGEVYAVDENEEDVEEGNEKDAEHLSSVMERCKNEKAVYMYSLGVLPEYEGKDIGKRLMMNLLIDLKEKGYKKVFGHLKEGGSSHLAHFFEGNLLETREDWFQTGKTYFLYEIDLTKFLLINFQPYIQETNYDCGVACLEAIYNHANKSIKAVIAVKGDGMKLPDMVMAISNSGETPDIIKNIAQLYTNLSKGKPCIITVLMPGYYEGHYLIVIGHGKNIIYVQDVSEGRIGRMSVEELERAWWTNLNPFKWGITI
jgi:GNAT superfamily N-acetyltransferase